MTRCGCCMSVKCIVGWTWGALEKTKNCTVKEPSYPTGQQPAGAQVEENVRKGRQNIIGEEAPGPGVPNPNLSQLRSGKR